MQVGALRAAECTSLSHRAWLSRQGRVSCGAGVLAGPGVDLLFIGHLDKGAGGGARKEEPARGSLNEFVNQTRRRSLNGPLKPCLTVD